MFRNKSLIAFLAVAATLAFVAVEAMAGDLLQRVDRAYKSIGKESMGGFSSD